LSYLYFPFVIICLFSAASLFAFAETPHQLKEVLLQKALSENLLRDASAPIEDAEAAASTARIGLTQRSDARLNKPTLIAVSFKLLLLSPIYFHQKILTHQDGDSCTFTPSCSHYGVEAIRRRGLRGLLMTSDRLLRCHAGNHRYYPRIHGLAYDPVPLEKGDE
jgi:hypothetical protein